MKKKKYFEHHQFVLLHFSSHELDPAPLYNYLHYAISVRMLSWVGICMETLAVSLSVQFVLVQKYLMTHHSEGLPKKEGIRRGTTFLKKTYVRAEGGESHRPCLQFILSSQPWDLTIGDLWEADFCFWAGDVKSEP